MIERRRYPRNPARQRAYIVLQERRAPLSCIIRETSPVGTLVEHSLGPLPDRFHLLVGSTELRYCRLVRQTQGEAGVEYLS